MAAPEHDGVSRARVDRREWNDLAAEDALWAVYSDMERRHGWDEEEFYATGEAEVAGLLAGLEGDGGLTVRYGSALDFGCGVGRLSRALAARFDTVVGVDIAEGMLRRAEALNAGRENLRFVRTGAADLAPLPDGGFDLVLSFIALQHTGSAAQIGAYLREFVRVAAPGGVIVVQIPTGVARRVRLHPLRLANRGLRALPWAPASLLRRLTPYSMRLTAMAAADVRAALTAAGATLVTDFPDRRTGSPLVPSRVYVAQLGQSPSADSA